MNTLMLRLIGATALAAFATPVLADKTDRLMADQYRDKIAAARAEPGVAQNGSAELDRATAAVAALPNNLDENETGQAKSIMAEIDALIETARKRAEIATLKDEVARMRSEGGARVADAEATAAAAQQSAAAAQQSAAAAQAENARLRSAMRDYQMKQTQYGATLVLTDVVFETGRADLKPGAQQRLRPLAAYLQANPDVRVRIDGHTDAQGSDAANLQLSQRRAEAVGSVMASLGVDRSRVSASGHGESQPVADNRTPAGRQQNRRVEVTLVGQQANSFAAVAQ
jgi:outer membrane protein OmpA-like peptidoglycan-associated protein